jgi:beta-ribofuranosylaminobenzene 5'-phosphate synthase
MNRLDQHQLASVEVVTGSRLHFGLFTDQPPTGFGRRSFGGVGVMIDQPNWSISLTRSNENDHIEVSDPSVSSANSTTLIDRAKEVLAQYREHRKTGPVELVIRDVVPSHMGFGSGTQFALAIAQALDSLDGIKNTADQLAQIIGRGKRSAIGTWGFEKGGLIIDAGKDSLTSIGSLVFQTSVPADWRFVLLTDSNTIGINGEPEIKAFADSPGMPQELTDSLCRIALTEIAPAFAEVDHSAAARALDDYGNRVGRYFSKIQGGTFSSPDVARAVAQLRFDGITGITQTSWGPTCSVLCPGTSTATAIANRVNAINSNVTATIVQPLNTGAQVTTSPGL